MFEEIAKSIATALITATPFILKSLADNKTRRKESKVLLDSLREVSNGQSDLTEQFKEFKDDHDFRGRFKDTLRTKAAVYSHAGGLTRPSETILMTLALHLENIAMRFYYTKFRGKETELKNYLGVEFSAIVSDIKALLKANDDQVITYNAKGDPKAYYLSQWVEKSELFRRISILETRLGDNGFKTYEDYEAKFIEMSLKIFDEFIKALSSFRQLQ